MCFEKSKQLVLKDL